MTNVGHMWGSQGPPPEAYGRVTDAQRYRELHTVAHSLLNDLQQRFDVTRELSTESDRHSPEPAPVVRLVPADPAASALTIVFDAFPGVLVRMGHDGGTHQPVCGCDACDEPVQRCAEQLRGYVEVCVTGAFGERLVHDDTWWHERWYEFPTGVSWDRAPLDVPQRDALREAFAGDEMRWAPWPQRAGDTQ